MRRTMIPPPPPPRRTQNPKPPSSRPPESKGNSSRTTKTINLPSNTKRSQQPSLIERLESNNKHRYDPRKKPGGNYRSRSRSRSKSRPRRHHNQADQYSKNRETSRKRRTFQDQGRGFSNNYDRHYQSGKSSRRYKSRREQSKSKSDRSRSNLSKRSRNSRHSGRSKPSEKSRRSRKKSNRSSRSSSRSHSSRSSSRSSSSSSDSNSSRESRGGGGARYNRGPLPYSGARGLLQKVEAATPNVPMNPYSSRQKIEVNPKYGMLKKITSKYGDKIDKLLFETKAKFKIEPLTQPHSERNLENFMVTMAQLEDLPEKNLDALKSIFATPIITKEELKAHFWSNLSEAAYERVQPEVVGGMQEPVEFCLFKDSLFTRKIASMNSDFQIKMSQTYKSWKKRDTNINMNTFSIQKAQLFIDDEEEEEEEEQAQTPPQELVLTNAQANTTNHTAVNNSERNNTSMAIENQS